jgi:hypothetical protein
MITLTKKQLDEFDGHLQAMGMPNATVAFRIALDDNVNSGLFAVFDAGRKLRWDKQAETWVEYAGEIS